MVKNFEEWCLLVRVLQTEALDTTNNNSENGMGMLQDMGLHPRLALSRTLPIISGFLSSRAYAFGARVNASAVSDSHPVLRGRDMPTEWVDYLNNNLRGTLRDKALAHALDALALYSRGLLPSGELVLSVFRPTITVCTAIHCRLYHNLIPCRCFFLWDLYRREGILGWERNQPLAATPEAAHAGPSGAGGVNGDAGGAESESEEEEEKESEEESEEEEDDDDDREVVEGVAAEGGSATTSTTSSHPLKKSSLFDDVSRPVPDKAPAWGGLPGAGSFEVLPGSLVAGCGRLPSGIGQPASHDSLAALRQATDQEELASASSVVRSAFRGTRPALWSNPDNTLSVNEPGRPNLRNRTREQYYRVRSMPRKFKGDPIMGEKAPLLTQEFFQANFIDPNSEGGVFLGFHALRRVPVEDWSDGYTKEKGKAMLERLSALSKVLSSKGAKPAALQAALSTYDAAFRVAYPPDSSASGRDDADVPADLLAGISDGPTAREAVSRADEVTANFQNLAFADPVKAHRVAEMLNAMTLDTVQQKATGQVGSAALNSPGVGKRTRGGKGI
jgi:hypothetical protein